MFSDNRLIFFFTCSLISLDAVSCECADIAAWYNATLQLHYANTPMLYTAIFTTVKFDNYYIFLIFAQNIGCEYTRFSVRRF